MSSRSGRGAVEIPVTGSDTPQSRGLIANASSLFAGRLGIAVMGWAGTVLIV